LTVLIDLNNNYAFEILRIRGMFCLTIPGLDAPV
jgi:hypothetical protein